MARYPSKQTSYSPRGPVILPEQPATPPRDATGAAAALGAPPSPEGLPRKTSSYGVVGSGMTNALG